MATRKRSRFVRPIVGFVAALVVVAAVPVSAAVTCGAVVTTDLTLTADLHCAGTDGLVAGADGITIDLNGYTVSGDETTVGTVGVRVRGFTGVTVSNGTVRDFYIGVVVETDDRGTPSPDDDIVGEATVTGITSRSNLVFGFLLTTAPGARESTAAFVGNAAIGNADPGFWFDRGSFVSRDNLSRDNGGVGYGVHGSVGSLTDDRAINNGLQGVLVVDSQNPLDTGVAVVTNVLARDNGLSGFTVGGGGDATFESSRAFSNGEFGFECGWIGTGTISDLGGNKAKMNAWAPQDTCGLDL